MPYNVHYSHVTLCCVHSIQQSLISSPLYRQATLESLKKIDDFKRNKVFSSKRSCRLHHFITYWVTSNAHNRVFFWLLPAYRIENLTYKKVWSINLKFKTFLIFLLESFLMCFFVCLAFLKRRLLMPWHLRS